MVEIDRFATRQLWVAEERRHEVVYAPICPKCGSSEFAHWHRLPTVLESLRGESGVAWCDRDYCRAERRNAPDIYVSSAACFAAREPERLERRLVELRSEVKG